MNNLHAAFALRNLKAFKQELDGTSNSNAHRNGHNHGHGVGSGSAGRSWQLREFASSTPTKADPNERDVQGRTVLHLACAATDNRAYEFVQCLLRHQQIAVNIQDVENGYTALHRALYAGNVRAARDLLARHDTDVGVKDAEGMTAFDVFNSTVEGTNPAYDAAGTDLYVWGVNRNFTLGVGDPNDRIYPDHVTLANQSSERTPFSTPKILDVRVSKLHSAVVTDDSRSNLQLCGFGSHGRLGRTIHSQYSFQPIPDTPQRITAVSLGQDHTLALTSAGYVLSWGQNRFSQLGYEADSEIQVSPRRIVGPLKKEFVLGVAAGRMASACWTSDAVWTWGTNAGQLGYEKAANPVQVLPRKATAISQPVLAIAISDYAMCCLLDTHEVVCLHHDAHFKISFSTPKVLSDAFPFRPPQSTLKPMIVKITSAATSFAALSSIGDVFTFNLPNPLEELAKDARDRHVTVKPQLIWALRKHFTAVKDVALGSDGTVIICTHSGHVFVRQRTGKAGSGALKFKRIPYLQRVVKVTTNDTGAFAAVRVDARPEPIPLTGSVLDEDIGSLQPHMRRFQHQITAADFERLDRLGNRAVDEDDDESTNSVAKDTRVALELCTIMSRWDVTSTDSLFSWSEPLLGSDLVIIAGGRQTPAHRSIVAQRIPALRQLGSLANGRVRLSERDGVSRLEIDGVHHFAVLLLLQYIYTDDVAAIWDPRVARRIQEVFGSLKLSIVRIKEDLRDLVEILGITVLEPILASAGKNASGQRTLSEDLAAFFTVAQASPTRDADIVIQLADREVNCSSILLRARCPFFEAMLDDADWTRARADAGGVVKVDMRHLKWRPMRLVFRYMYEGIEENLFDYSHQETLDEFLDFVFEVTAAATELLLDRLVLVCSRVILQHVNTHNACSLAVEAGFYQATKLRESILDYIIVCMETMLESGLLDEMDADTLNELSAAVKARQEDKLPTPKRDMLLNRALDANKDWLALQDYPAPRIRTAPRQWRPSHSPKFSPVDLTSGRYANRGSPSPLASPDLAPVVPTNAIDDIFSMDEDAMVKGLDDLHVSAGTTPRASGASTPVGRTSGPVWKSRAVEAEKKTDMRSIMAEAAGSTSKSSSSTMTAVPVTPVSKLSQKDRRKLQHAPPTPSLSAQATSFTPGGATASPWRKPAVPPTPVSTVDANFTSSLAESRAKPTLTPARSQGPVFTPTRSQPAAGPATIRKTSDSAWVNSTVFAPAPVSSSPGASHSLLEIQRQERDHSHNSKTKKAKSLVEIQEEERVAEQEKLAEEEFMRWWKEEEARVAAIEAGNVSTSAKRGRGGGRGRGQPRRVPGRGGMAAAPSTAAEEGHPPKDGGTRRGRNRTSKSRASQSQVQDHRPVL